MLRRPSRRGWSAFACGVASIGLVAGGLAAVAPPAAAAPAWSVVPSPSPPGPHTGTLNGIACPSATVCIAVGDGGLTPRPIAQHWNGTDWTAVPMPTPGSARLSGVACTSPTNCFAVGNRSQGGKERTLIERWNGSSWKIVSSPNRAGADNNMLSAVTCPTAKLCFAVGVSSRQVPSGGAHTLIERRNGSGWAIVKSADPAGSGPWLKGVACMSKTNCLAVGRYLTGKYPKQQFHALVERWNGTAWSIVSDPLPKSQYASLEGVSCAGGKLCFAVGNLGRQSLIERWNGSTLSRAAHPSTIGSSLSSVSCASPTSCVAVGAGHGTKLRSKHWNGKSWKVLEYPATEMGVEAVACISANRCFATSQSHLYPSGTVTSIGRWDGTRWTIVPTANGSSQSSLAAVACTSTSDCLAIGNATRDSLAEHWNGTSWSIVDGPPRPPGAPSAIMWKDIACGSATACAAVGSYYPNPNSSSEEILVAATWNGSSWSPLSTVRPAGASSSRLSGVACPGPTTCYAVGYSRDAATLRTLVEKWNGTTWTIVDSPADAFLNGISCVSATDCFAVGTAAVPAESLGSAVIAHWDGVDWENVATPAGVGAPTNLEAVSCSAASSCVAVGEYYTPDHWGRIPHAAAMQWNGTSWSVTPSPGSSLSYLARVACVTPTNCVATSGTMTAQWDGSAWSTVGVATPSGATSYGVSGVACPTSTCFAVGTSSTDISAYTLVEQLA